MSEKLLIITEKPDAAKSFARALGGMTGMLDGDEYAIVNLLGHVLSSGVPDEVALPDHRETVGKFANLGGIPWNPSWFDFNKKKPSHDSGARIVRDIAGYLRNGFIPVIATDIDESGEGDLLAREVLVHLNYHGKTYREYHLDESEKSITKAMKNKAVVDESDPVYQMAFARSNMDYLTQQLTRVATMTIQEKGYKLPAPVPMGRLQSVIVVIVGDQTKLINAYKPSSVFESRYKLGTLMLTGKDMPTFKTKAEWSADGLPFESGVREVRQVNGHTIPPKAVTLSKLAGLMAKKGMKSKQFLETYQKMYEAGYMTYPRTEDDFISPEQFNEMAPMVDTLLNLLSLPTALFTHREARNTHVKTGGAHGAIRPGLKVPNSVDELNTLFGAYASDIYKVAGERFLMMYLENTEWVRHEYETTDTPTPFKGSVKIITKQGVVDPDENQDDIGTTLPDLNGKAELYPHEVKSRKPHAVTTEWLFDQLAKVNVGTGATRVSTVANMSCNKPSFPIKEGKTLELSMMGWVGHQAADGTTIGSVEGTHKITELVNSVKDGAITPHDACVSFTQIIANDVEVLKSTAYDLEGLGVPKGQPKIMASGTWNGREVSFNKVYSGHEFTDSEVETLLAGGEVTISVKLKDGKDATVVGSLADQEYKGNKYVGFKGVFAREGYVDGVWNGKPVTIKGGYMDYVFTPEELETLFAGGSVAITATSNGNPMALTGKLEEQTYQGRNFVGYKALREGQVAGVWKGTKVSFNGRFMDHVFTEAEVAQLLADETIAIKTTKGDKQYDVTGKLEVQDYKGNKFVGFKADFGSSPREGYVTGNWKGKDVSFKGEFMNHTFTTAEVAKLVAGESITFKGTSGKGTQMDVTGRLENQTYQGRKFVGFKADFGKKK